MATPANTTRWKSILVTEAHGKFMMIYSHQSSSVIYIIYKYHYSVWSTIIIYIYIIYIIGDLPCYNWVTTCYNYKNTIHSYHEEVVTTPSSCFSWSPWPGLGHHRPRPIWWPRRGWGEDLIGGHGCLGGRGQRMATRGLTCRREVSGSKMF